MKLATIRKGGRAVAAVVDEQAGRVFPLETDMVSLIRSGERPESSRYLSVSASIGKIAQVEPNSGDMLPIVARSAIGRPARPAP